MNWGAGMEKGFFGLGLMAEGRIVLRVHGGRAVHQPPLLEDLGVDRIFG
ncbi:MAG: hypothetical protein OXQ93_07900 [Gemmatimonadota bacterium]|nr:hypothetical protein [bacterium]MDE2875346.1 hypothetical protein [Gemmatimonadota bacterium]